MSKKDKVDNDEQPVIDLQALLKHSALMDENIRRESEETSRLEAMEEHGLVDPASVKSGKGSSKIEMQLRSDIEAMKIDRTASDEEYQQIIADLTKTIAERDAQIQRLGEELELKNAETTKDDTETEETSTSQNPPPAVKIPPAPVIKQPWEQ